MKMSIEKSYELAREQFAQIGVDTDKAIERLKNIPISIHCWQGDDVAGFENLDGGLDGGLAVTGNYPGKAKTPDQLRADMNFAFSLIPGPKKANIHAFYSEPKNVKVDRDSITTECFTEWADWAVEQKIGLDFNPTCFSHAKSSDGLTLSHPDEGIRQFWIDHCIRSREISEFLGKRTGIRSVNNIWVPDGYKDNCYDKVAPRARLLDSLNKIEAKKLDSKYTKDAVESKVFAVGVEAFTVGSHEFYMGYGMKNPDVMVCLDAGHFHPTEVISNKISSMLLFSDEILLHVSRPMRWDSDHVVILDDELQAIAQEIIRNDFESRVNIALDFFDASINRIAAWVIGSRNTQKALLKAMLEPIDLLKKAEYDFDFTTRLALTEEYKSYPFGAVWDYYCEQMGVPTREAWLEKVRTYEKDVLLKR
ncbi:MAG: L-rhamnose isomerase [Clostridia bacterium]|nr:L-rhamnose isomerase [Clostridia bacterium]